jgi:hypothetical protein
MQQNEYLKLLVKKKKISGKSDKKMVPYVVSLKTGVGDRMLA